MGQKHVRQRLDDRSGRKSGYGELLHLPICWYSARLCLGWESL